MDFFTHCCIDIKNVLDEISISKKSSYNLLNKQYFSIQNGKNMDSAKLVKFNNSNIFSTVSSIIMDISEALLMFSNFSLLNSSKDFYYLFNDLLGKFS